MIDLNHIDKNVLLHCGGRCGSYRLADLLLMNNHDLCIDIPECNTPTFEYHFVQRWINKKHIMVEDLKNLNKSGKHWLIKSGCTHNIIEILTSSFDFQEIGLVRLDLTSTVLSFVISALTSKYHLTGNSPPENLEDSILNFCKLNQDSIGTIVDLCSSRALMYADNTITLWHLKDCKFPLVTYEQITSNPEMFFQKTDTTTTFTSSEIFSEEVTRWKTPVYENLNSLLIPIIKKKTKPVFVEKLNLMTKDCDWKFFV